MAMYRMISVQIFPIRARQPRLTTGHGSPGHRPCVCTLHSGLWHANLANETSILSWLNVWLSCILAGSGNCIFCLRKMPPCRGLGRLAQAGEVGITVWQAANSSGGGAGLDHCRSPVCAGGIRFNMPPGLEGSECLQR